MAREVHGASVCGRLQLPPTGKATLCRKQLRTAVVFHELGSGCNDFRGTAFEYFRNDVLDANNWFANNAGLQRAELRQNDFGGVLGGPILKGKLFFFGSYEGLRVRQPKVANTYELTPASIQSAPTAVQPLLNAFPKPNGKDLGNGTAQFLAFAAKCLRQPRTSARRHVAEHSQAARSRLVLHGLYGR